MSKFLRGTGDSAALLNHIQYFTKCSGKDAAHSSQNSRAEKHELPERNRSREPFRSLRPHDDFAETLEMTSSLAWTHWPLDTVGPVQRGDSDDIRKIIGGIIMRVANETIRKA